jgi:hypothetical protein
MISKKDRLPETAEDEWMPGDSQWQVAVLPDGSIARTKHTWNGEPMKPARHLILAVHPDGPMIYRYADDWQFAGDTWHENLEAALGQIEFEFAVSNLQWKTVSETEANTLMTQGKGT